MSMPAFQGGHTVQFTWTSSVAPDSAPIFSVVNTAGTVLSCGTAITSGATQFYQLFTMPDSSQFLLTRWRALKTVQGSAYQFLREAFIFVDEVRFPL